VFRQRVRPRRRAGHKLWRVLDEIFATVVETRVH
jgi:hypothetical protein